MIVPNVLKSRGFDKTGNDIVDLNNLLRYDSPPGQRQQVLNDGCAFLRGLEDLFDVSPGFLPLGNFGKQKLGISGKDAQDVVQIMGDAARQLTKRLHLLRPAQTLFQSSLLRLRPLPVGDVFGDAHQVFGLSVRV